MLISHIILAQIKESDPELFLELKKECEQKYIELMQKNLNFKQEDSDNKVEIDKNSKAES